MDNNIDNDKSLDSQLEFELNTPEKEDVVAQINQEAAKPEVVSQFDQEAIKPEIVSQETIKPREKKKKGKEPQSDSAKEQKVLGVGEWMLTIFVFLIPVINIIAMAVWAFASKGNIHRRNLSRALLLWVIILLIAYVVAMSIAGFTIIDVFINI